MEPVQYRVQEAPSLELSALRNHVLIDLRHRGEWLLGHIMGSRNMPFEDYNEIPDELLDCDLAVYCGSGYRASMFLANAKKANLDRIVVNGSVVKSFGDSTLWCSRPHNGSICNP